MSILDKASLIQIPSGYKSTKLYSLRPINGDGDFTFARSSSATRVNSEGLIETAKVLGTTELVTNGNFADTSWWTFESGVSVSNNKANFNTALTNYGIYKNNLLTSNKFYQVQFEITDYTSGSVHFNIGGVVNGSFNSVGVKTLVVNSLSGTNVFGIQSASGGAVLSITNVSVIEYIENDVPRLDYSDGSCASLLLEGQSTNILPYSEDFANSAWSKSNVTLTSNNTISPDGTQNASKLVSTGADGNLQDSISVASGTTYTFSVYLKTISGTLDIAISLGSPGFPQNEGDGGRYKNITVTNEWKRYTITSTADASASTGVGVGGFNTFSTGEQVYVWGAQLEAKNYVSSYIPTSGSTVTRTADVCNNAGTAATFNDSEGVLFAEVAALADDLTNRGITISDGSVNNRVTMFFTNVSNAIQVKVVVGGSNSLNSYITIPNISLYNKFALKYKQNDFSLFVNGFELITDTSGNTFSSGTLTELAFDRGDGAEDFYGKCKQLMVFNEALSDEELSDLTGQANLSFNNLATFYGYTIL